MTAFVSDLVPRARRLGANSIVRFAMFGLVLLVVLGGAVVIALDHQAPAGTGQISTAARQDSPAVDLGPARPFVEDVRERAADDMVAAIGALVLFYGSVVVLFAYEVRRRLALETRVAAVQRYEHLGLLAAGAAHDFNNMLQAISGNTALARMTVDPASPAHEHLAEVAATVERAASLTRQLRVYAGGGDRQHERFDLREVAVDTVRMMQGATSGRVKLEIAIPGQLPPVAGDESQLRQVVLNLVANALDALEGRGAVLVSGGRLSLTRPPHGDVVVGDAPLPGEFAYVEVSDNGPGSAAVLDRIFEPYYSSKGTGRGLGLAAVAGIVRGHDGYTTVTSEVGRGATFRVYLPCLGEDIEPAVPAPSAA